MQASAVSLKKPSKPFRVVGTTLCLIVAITAYRYVVGIGPLSPLILGNLNARFWLVFHVASAATALLVGPFPFFLLKGEKNRRVHKVLGRIYGIACLLGGVSGFVLAFGALTGPVSTAGFGLLSILWFVTTLRGVRTAMKRDFVGHRRWILRSFALTLAAVTLRLYLFLLPFVPVPFEVGYRAVSFLCWVPNLIAAELLLRRRKTAARSGVPGMKSH